MGEFRFKSVNIRQAYKQERGCLMHCTRLANTLLKDEGTARDSRDLLVNNLLTYRMNKGLFGEVKGRIKDLDKVTSLPSSLQENCGFKVSPACC